MNKFLIISLGWEQENLFLKLKKYKHDIFATYHTNKLNVDLDFYEYCDPRDLSKLINICKKYKIKNFISDQCDYSNYAVNFLRTFFNTHIFDFHQIQATSNKFLMRELCKSESITQPRYQLCRSIHDINYSLNFIDYPILFKPLDNRGSTGVNVIKTKKNIQKKFYETLIHSNSKEVLLESYIEGKHVSVDSLIDDEGKTLILGIGEKKHSDKEKKIIIQVNYPALIDKSSLLNLKNTHNQVIKALNITRGISHAEYIIDKKGRPFLIEIASRGGGVLTSCTILKIISKIDTVDYLYREALGLKTKLKKIKMSDNFLVSLKFLKFKPGKVKNISINQSFFNKKEVEKFKIFIEKNSKILDPKNGSERHGFVILKAKNYKALKVLENNIYKSIRISYEKK